jgi:glycerol-3-phosphate dehydrogenase
LTDVIIIGAGVSGCAVARELSRSDLSVEVLEAGYDVACGASRTNSGIVHGGFDPAPGTAKALYNVRGARLVPLLSREIGFRYRPCGSIVLAFGRDEERELDVLMARAKANGVDDVRIIDADELRRLEPNVSGAATSALLCESSGICDPFGMTVALAESAATNGVSFRFGASVSHVRRIAGSWEVETPDGTCTRARAVVNAAGVSAIDLHNEVSSSKLESRPRAGEYVLLDRDHGSTFSHTMFRVPGPEGKGVLVSPTVEGNLIVGPDAVDVSGAQDTWTTPEGLAWVAGKARDIWPGFDRRGIIVNFAGVRPSGADGDFVLGEPTDAPGFFDVAAFDSPGLTASVAVAQDIAADVERSLAAGRNTSFVSHRDMPSRFIEMGDEERSRAIARDPLFGHLVCRCEQVSEAEILAAIHAPLPATTIVGVKRRCRAGTGRCQGGFCEPLVAEIISRETGIPISDVRLEGPGSEIGPQDDGEVRS